MARALFTLISTLLVLAMPGQSSFAADEPVQDPTEAESLSISAVDERGMISCAYSDLLLSYLNEMPDEEARAAAASEAERLRTAWKTDSEVSAQGRRLRKAVVRDLEVLAHSADTKSGYRKALEGLCQSAVTVGGGGLRATALTLSAIESAFAVPIGFTYRFGRALVGKSPTKKASLYQVAGKQLGQSLWFTVAYQGIRLAALSGSPYLLAAYGLVAVDQALEQACENPNPKNPRELKFCAQFASIKKLYNSGADVGAKAGSSVRRWALKYRRTGVCELSFRKQLASGKRWLELRRDEILAWDPDVREVVLRAPDVDGCINAIVATKSDEAAARLTAAKPAFVDGIAIVFQGPGIQAAAPTPEPKNPVFVCNQARRVSAQSAQFTGSMDTYRAAAQSLYNPGVLAPLSLVQVPSEANMKRQDLSQIGRLRNVVLLWNPSQEDVTQAEAMKPEFKKLSKKFKRMRKDFHQLSKPSTTEQCTQEVDRLDFDWEAYVKLRKEMQSFAEYKRWKEFDQLRKLVKKGASPKFWEGSRGLKWEIVDFHSLNEVNEVVRASDVQNIVLIGHGQGNGKIVDSWFNELPTTAFGAISPAVMSISFFSCFSQDAVESYGLREKLTAQPSYYATRWMGGVAPNEWMDLGGETPIIATTDFLKRVDDEVLERVNGAQRAQAVQGSHLPILEEQEACGLRVPGFEVKTGAYHVRLDQRWVGTIYPPVAVSGQALQFPCAWLTPGDHQFVLTNASLVGPSTTASLEFEAQLVRKQTPVNLPRIRKIQRADGTIQSVSIQLSDP